MFELFQDFVDENKELVCINCGQIRQQRGIYLTWNFDIRKEFDIENLFIGELLVTNESRTLNFSNNVTLVDGRKRRREYVNSKLTKL